MPKNVMCKNCNNLKHDWCDKKIDSPDPDMVRDCQYFWEKTNADRIRAMSDEELAKWMCKRLDCHGEKCPGVEKCSPEHNGLMVWLQQPADEKGE